MFGAGGQAKETIDLIEENNKGRILGFVDINRFETSIFNYKCLGEDKDINHIIKKYKATHFIVAIGDLKRRSKIYNSIINKLKPLSVFSKAATISKYSKFGDHVLIYPGVIINADVEVGSNVIVNSNSSIGHEAKIGNHVNINPGANIAGRVIVRDFCTIGIGASIKENLIIDRSTTIGGGAMVVKNTKSNKTYTGIPAKILEE